MLEYFRFPAKCLGLSRWGRLMYIYVFIAFRLKGHWHHSTIAHTRPANMKDHAEFMWPRIVGAVGVSG